MSLLLAVRVRGQVNRSEEARRTLELLRLRRPYWATLLRSTPAIMGMLRKVQYYVMWEEADEEMLTLLLAKRAELRGGKRLTDDVIRQWGYEDIRGLAKALLEGKVDLRQLDSLKPFFRLHPPIGGFRRPVKRLYEEGGIAGRNPQLKKLLAKMV
jgi:large subunit ribosomal protein L30